MASAGKTLSKLITGTGTIIDKPATKSIEPLNRRTGLLLKGSMRGRPAHASTWMVRLTMAASKDLTRTFNSRLASQAGKGSD